MEEKEREEPRNREKSNSLGMEFVLVEEGEFMMGAVPQDEHAGDREKPQHLVRITSPFYIGKYPVTQEEWQKLMGKNPSKFQDAGRRAPVESVSWPDSQEFIKKLSKKDGKLYRLPTEAEWEYAARGGGSRNSPTIPPIYTYGNDGSRLGDYAWFEDNSIGTTHPVGQKKPNILGLYDMMGNVWEWCEDRYGGESYRQSQENDPGGATGGGYRVLRGGSWGSSARAIRLSFRYGINPDTKNHNIGFRLVLLP